MIARVLISPDLEAIKKEINSSLDLNHPDVLFFGSGSKLGIEQARQINKHFSMKPYSAKGRALVLEDASSLTFDAQNALLKLLEEPPEEALLLLGAKSESDLLPTVISRCQIVILKGTPAASLQHDIEKLLQLDIEERFEYIEKCKKREELLHALTIYFREQMLLQLTNGRGIVDFVKQLLQAEEWAAQNVNIRAILEYLMLVCPSQR